MNESPEHPFGGRKLFAVEITEEIYVLAFDEEEATEISQEQAACGGDIDWNDANYMADEAARIAKPWANAIPFGTEGNEWELYR